MHSQYGSALHFRHCSLYAFVHLLGIQSPDFTPEFISFGVEVDKGGRKTDFIYRSQFAPDFFLDVHADDDDAVHEIVF